MTTKLIKFGAKVQLIERVNLVFDEKELGPEATQEMEDTLIEEGWRVTRSGPYIVNRKVQGTKSEYVLERSVGETS